MTILSSAKVLSVSNLCNSQRVFKVRQPYNIGWLAEATDLTCMPKTEIIFNKSVGGGV